MGQKVQFTIKVPMSVIEELVDEIGMFSVLEPRAVFFTPAGDLGVEFEGESVDG